MNNLSETDVAHSNTGVIKTHPPEDFAGMAKAGRLAAETLDFITPYVVPGAVTGEARGP